jgi:hypothetical protein
MKQQRNRQRASTRIGPHPKYVLELMIGNLLGDGSLEKRSKSTRFVFSQAGKNQEYLYWLHAQYAAYGYCSENIPKQSVQIGKGNIVHRRLRFRTWSYTSLNWLYDDFYKSPVGILIPWKKIPEKIDKWLTPVCLAVWFMDDGSAGSPSGGLKIATHCFAQADLIRVQKALQTKYHLSSSLYLNKKNSSQYVLAFGQKDATTFAKVISPWIHPSMRYKLRFVRSL